MAVYLNLFKRLFQYTVIAPEFQGILLSDMLKIFKNNMIFCKSA